MLHQGSLSYTPTDFLPIASGGEHEMDAALPSSNNGFAGEVSGCSNGHTASVRECFSQQQLLRRSVGGGRASYVAGVRSSTAYGVPANASSVTAAAVNGSMPLVPALPVSLSAPPADGYAGFELDLAPGNDSYTSANNNTIYKQQGVHPSYTPPQEAALTAAGEDFVHEVLAMNTMAMEQCYAALGSVPSAGTSPSMAAATEEPMKILREAFMRLDDTSAQDLPGPLLDQLKATTLNNMGVVECNRGQPRQALSHFEAARQLEENNDMASPSVALNTCAAYNALQMYDKATAAALEAIEMLRALETQRQRSRQLAAAVTTRQQQQRTQTFQTNRHGDRKAPEEDALLNDKLLLEAASAPQIAESQNAALWGAAWNNLAVAQINTARDAAPKDTSEYTNALTLFQNAMRATQELLGPQHPMSRTVVETYRSVRLALRNHGAFKQHRTLLRAPLPPVDPREQAWEEEQVEPSPGQTRHNALIKQRQQLTITFRGEVTSGQKLIERVDGTPYPGATSEAYQSRYSGRAGHSSARTSSNGSKGNHRGKRTLSSSKKNAKSGALRGMPHSETLTRASVVYGNPHPLLYTPPPPRPPSESAPPSLPCSARAPQPPPPRASVTDLLYDNAGMGAGGRKDNNTRQKRPSPPPPPSQYQPQHQQHNQRSQSCSQQQRPQREQNSASLRSGHRGSSASQTGFVLPPIAQGRKGDSYPSNDDDEMSKTNGTTVSSVFMHVPPPAPPRYESPEAAAAAAVRLQQSKMLLFASPSSASAPAADQYSGYPAAAATDGSGSSSDRSRQHLGSLLEDEPLPSASSHVRSACNDDEDHHGDHHHHSASGDTPSHELFQGMWVAADAHYVHRGPRVFGRPVYYTISTTLDVNEDGVPAAPQGHPVKKHLDENLSSSSAAAVDAGPDASLEPAAGGRTALPTLTYSDSSSEEGDKENNRCGSKDEGREACYPQQSDDDEAT